MHSIKGKHIIVAVSGGIAAYKAIEVVSRLKKLGAEVKVIMTDNATKLVTPLTFGEISNNPVAVDMWEEIHDWNVEHIALATWADAFVVVPATANVIGKIANGIADDMLTTVIMATNIDKFICPAMNTGMYNNPIVQENISKLRSLGYQILTPASGMLACGVEGIGRLPEPKAIVEWIQFNLTKTDELKGKTVIVSAGGTKEAVDPVRYIGNHSSGKMGYALASEFALRGAKTILVSAPTQLQIPYGVERIDINSAIEMKSAIEERFDEADIVVMAAAVSDFRVANTANQKIKKQDELILELVKNPDILQSLGAKKKNQILVGFAAETNDVIKYAKDKLVRKNADIIIANDVSKADAGFNVDTNAVTIVYKSGDIKELPLMLKSEVSKHIVNEIITLS